jgi:hypothetical protein
MGGTMIWRESAGAATVKGWEAELTLVGAHVATWRD